MHGLIGVQGKFHLDEAVLEQMPKGIEIVSAEAYGVSAWTRTAKVSTTLPDGTYKRYFLKCAVGDHAKTMLCGEFTSMKEIYALVPGLVPVPHGWGRYTKTEPEIYFFLSDFVDMSTTAPDPERLAMRLAELHLKSRSPSDMFGYHVITCDGRLPLTVEWEASWARFFSKLLRGVLKLDAEVNGIWDELDAAAEHLVAAVIPRLLGILQADDRVSKSSLIHGDCWEGQSCFSHSFIPFNCYLKMAKRFHVTFISYEVLVHLEGNLSMK